MDRVRIKFCGLSQKDHIRAAADAGAAYVGFVFFPKSPRHLELHAARALALDVPPGMAKVALVVNPDDAALRAIVNDVPLDMIQLHGAESPARVADIRARFKLPVMKAVGIRTADDLAIAHDYATVADQLLLDAKPSDAADLPGGNGLRFDWRIVQGQRFGVPWMLAGGLDPDNVATAIALTGAKQVDVSSGIEDAPGQKSPAKMAAFAAAAGVMRPG